MHIEHSRLRIPSMYAVLTRHMRRFEFCVVIVGFKSFFPGWTRHVARQHVGIWCMMVRDPGPRRLSM